MQNMKERKKGGIEKSSTEQSQIECQMNHSSNLLFSFAFV